jgi:hypothetical protein
MADTASTSVANVFKSHFGSKKRAALATALDGLAAVGRLRIDLVAGAAADTNIAIAGLTRGATILSILRFDIDTGAVRDVTDLKAEARILTNGNLQIDTTVTTGDKLLVVWVAEAATG